MIVPVRVGGYLSQHDEPTRPVAALRRMLRFCHFLLALTKSGSDATAIAITVRLGPDDSAGTGQASVLSTDETRG
jgi:hypothetical protein